MFKHKFFDILKTFSSRDLVKFRDFLKSPYFNKWDNLVKLFDEIVKYYPTFNSRELTKESLYNAVFKTKDYKDSTIRNQIAKLLTLAENYITVENFNKDSLSRDNYLLEELTIRDMKDLFVRHLKKMETSVLNFKPVDFDYIFNRYKLERNKFNHSLLNERIIRKKKVYTQIRKMNDSAEYLSIYYFAEIIGEYFNIIIYQEKFNTRQLSNFISIVLGCVDMERIYLSVKGKNDCDFIFEIYFALYQALSNLDIDSHYYQYRNLINKNRKKLSEDELSFHYSALVSCCILKSKLKGYSNEYSNEMLNLYTKILKEGFYKNRRVSYLPEPLYRDILLLEIRLKKLDLVEELIKDFSSKIDPKEKYNMFNFSNAFYYYEKGAFEKSLEYCNKIKLDYFIYKYDIKNLMLKIYYEHGFYEEALSMIHSYRELLRKDEFLSESRKVRYRNFIKYLKTLIMLKTGNKAEEVEFLKVKLQEINNISFKSWLLEKMI